MLDLVVSQFRNMQQAFEIVFQLYEDTEIGDLRNLARDSLARGVLFWDPCFPWIFCELLQTQSNSTTIFVDAQDLSFDRIALLQDFVGMRHLASP